MAGDWIKMRTALRSSPKVVRISSALNADRLRVVGGLHAVWSLADEHSPDGMLEGYSLGAIDDLIGWPGFAQAMQSVEWLKLDEKGIEIPRFEEHNGASAKRRAMESERKRADRKEKNVPAKSGQTSASDADKLRTREEKRREESKPTPPIPPEAAGKKKRVQRTPETTLPADFEVFAEMAAWAQGKGLVDAQIDAETERFIAHHQAKGTRWSDWEAAWRKWILNAIKFGLEVKPPMPQKPTAEQPQLALRAA